MIISKAGKVLNTVEGKFQWIAGCSLDPKDGQATTDGSTWLSWCQTKNFMKPPRFVQYMEEPLEFTAGLSTLMEDHANFDQIVFEPLGSPNWNILIDGDIFPVQGKVTVKSKVKSLTLIGP